MSEQKRYWKGVEEYRNDLDFVKNAGQEFPGINEGVDGMMTHRRDFLKMMGFGTAAVALAACETPVKKAIPWLVKPMDVDPGIANYYASSYVDGGDYCAVVVKTREGRPIKLEGNALSGVTRGGTSARTQAAVLDLYDTERYRGPLVQGKAAEWADVDRAINTALGSSRNVRLVSQTVMSPSTLAVIDDLKGRYPSLQHVQYDPVSYHGMLEANKQDFGQRALPAYDFSKARTIVSFGADFMGNWLSPVEFARQWSANRKLGRARKEMSRLYVFESMLSLTGANADYRRPVRPSEEGLYVAALYKALGGSSNAPAPKNAEVIAQAAKDLRAAGANALVVSGSNDPNVQRLVNAINQRLGAYGTTVEWSAPSYQRQGNDAAMSQFVDEMKAGRVDAVMFLNSNPAYDHPQGAEIAEALKKVKTSISFATRPNETSTLCNYVCPSHHFLETWGDAEPKRGYLSLMQPTIAPVFQTRAAEETLLQWAGKPQDYYSYVRNRWQQNYYSAGTGFSSFRDFWNYSLHDGVFEVNRPNPRDTEQIRPESISGYGEMLSTSGSEAVRSGAVADSVKAGLAMKALGANPSADTTGMTQPGRGQAGPYNTGGLNASVTAVAQTYKPSGEGIELVLYEKIGIGNGTHAGNPWLQEMPDPISKACWDNYACVPQSMAKEMDIEQGDMLKVTANGQTIELPALVQPGLARGTVAIALGYGRKVVGKAGRDVGKNAYPMVSATRDGMRYSAVNVEIAPGEGERQIAQTQTHGTMMARPIVQEARLTEYKQDPAAGREKVQISTLEGKVDPTDISLWKGHSYGNHFWGMSIDLNSCIGCGACTVACQVENNVPIVGRQEVINRREMHWIRIDRYYSSDGSAEEGYDSLEEAAENPEVVFHPVMCQHCNNAPCETVCPVLATTHSSEGLNQMTYNRCIGTRYCANNCPYKVRRFNWFSYYDNDQFADVNTPAQTELGRMVLNPDVTVRARGVMEKCSLCIQRIQDGKLNAKKEKRRPLDGEINTACAQACPTEAILFGDMNDDSSQLSERLAEEYDKRAYHLLAEINVRPSISYLTKIRNKA
ncbi:MAG: TAT-variant-translocated molybdopterin oxidoreductase [Catalinimonas sp.]